MLLVGRSSCCVMSVDVVGWQQFFLCYELLMLLVGRSSFCVMSVDVVGWQEFMLCYEC